jgi:hypothetical protein
MTPNGPTTGTSPTAYRANAIHAHDYLNFPDSFDSSVSSEYAMHGDGAADSSLAFELPVTTSQCPLYPTTLMDGDVNEMGSLHFCRKGFSVQARNLACVSSIDFRYRVEYMLRDYGFRSEIPLGSAAAGATLGNEGMD